MKSPALICVRRLDRGGAEMLECRLALTLNKLGFPAHLACQYDERMAGQAEGAARWLQAGVPTVHFLKACGSSVMLAPFRLNALVNRQKYGAVVTSNTGLATIAGAARGLGGQFRHIVAFHDYLQPHLRRKPRVLLWRLALKTMTRGYAISNYVRLRLLADQLVPPGRVVTILNSVGMMPQPTVAARSILRSELGLPQDARILLFCGRVVQSKGCDLAVIRLAPHLHRWNAWLLFCGTRDQGTMIDEREMAFGRELDRLVQESGTLERIRFLGHRADAFGLMAGADVLVHPARHEGFGLVLLESMAAKLPIVTTNRGGIPEVIAGTPYVPLELEDAVGFVAEVEKWLRLDPLQRTSMTEAVAERLKYFSDERRARAISALLYDPDPHL